MGSVAKSYLRKSFLIYEEIHKYLTIYEEAVSHIWLRNRSVLNFLIYEENLIFFLISATQLKPWFSHHNRALPIAIQQWIEIGRIITTKCFHGKFYEKRGGKVPPPLIRSHVLSLPLDQSINRSWRSLAGNVIKKLKLRFHVWRDGLKTI
jgi:hypothetical protein